MRDEIWRLSCLIPILPTKINGKTMFTLCRSCTSSNNQEKCQHTEDERSLTDTWVSLEIDEAVKHGYKVLKLYEVWHFDETEQYDPNTKSGGLFTGYINKGLKEKQEASGFPTDCTDPDAYIREYFDREGVLLDKEKIEKNPGRRQVAKDGLNTLWGYFALNTNKSQFKIITDQSEWQNLLVNDRYNITSETLVDEETLHVSFNKNAAMHSGNNRSNVIIASSVTAQGRLKLFREMNKLGDRVLYCDTDSIIFNTRPGEYTPELGIFLVNLPMKTKKVFIHR